MVCLAASRYSSGSGGRSDSSVSSARRTVVWGSLSARPASRVARSPRTFDRYISPAVARRNSPYSGCARRAISVPVRALDGDQAHLLGGGEVLAPHQVGKHVDVDRFVLRQRVHHQRDLGHQPVQLVADQIAHALRDGDVAVPDPHPGHLADPARGHLILDQPLQEQGVAAGEPPEPLRAARVDRTVQGSPRPSCAHASADNGSRSRRASRPSFHNAFTASGSVTAGADRHHEAGLAGLRQLVHDVRRELVEQVCVVDAEDEPTATLLGDKRIDHPPHARHGLGDIGRSVDEGRGEGAQRNRAGRSRPDHPGRSGARRGGLAQQLSRESRLANARRTGDHHTREIADPAQRPAQGHEFAVPPGQRITADHAPTITLSGARRPCGMRPARLTDFR